MYQSIPSFSIPLGDPGSFDQIFCPGDRDLTRVGHLVKDKLIPDANLIQ